MHTDSLWWHPISTSRQWHRRSESDGSPSSSTRRLNHIALYPMTAAISATLGALPANWVGIWFRGTLTRSIAVRTARSTRPGRAVCFGTARCHAAPAPRGVAVNYLFAVSGDPSDFRQGASRLAESAALARVLAVGWDMFHLFRRSLVFVFVLFVRLILLTARLWVSSRARSTEYLTPGSPEPIWSNRDAQGANQKLNEKVLLSNEFLSFSLKGHV